MRKCWIIPFATVLGYDTFSGKANLLGPRSLDSFGSDWHRCQSRRLHPMAGMEDIRRLDELPVKF